VKVGGQYNNCLDCNGFPVIDFYDDGVEFVRFKCSCCNKTSEEVELDPDEGYQTCIYRAQDNWNRENKA
jgi:hypothetical protein